MMQTTFSSFQSDRCASGTPCPCNTPKSACPSSLAVSRRCFYKNLYLLDKQWYYHAAAGVAAPCTCFLRDCDRFAPAPLPLDTLPRREELVVHDAPVVIDQKYHGSFVHSTFEEVFATYWQVAEAQGRWQISPDHRVLITGEFSKLFAHELWHTPGTGYDARTREPRQPFMKDLMRALMGSSNLTMFPERLPRYNLFKQVVVGGNYGRSVWVKGTFERRPPMATDAEYSLAVKRGALRHYYRFLAMRLAPAAPPPEALPPPKEVLFLNRQPGMSRSVSNAEELVQGLRQRLPEAAVTHLGRPSTSLLEMAQAMRRALLLITPHGAQLGSAPFMAAGAGVIELMPAGFVTRMYEHLCVHAGLAYVCQRLEPAPRVLTRAVLQSPCIRCAAHHSSDGIGCAPQVRAAAAARRRADVRLPRAQRRLRPAHRGAARGGAHRGGHDAAAAARRGARRPGGGRGARAAAHGVAARGGGGARRRGARGRAARRRARVGEAGRGAVRGGGGDGGGGGATAAG